MREISYTALPGDDGREIKRVARGNLGLSHRLFTSLKQKDALLLYYYQDMSQDEVAQALNTSSTTISKRLKQARETLRTFLERGAEP